MISFFDLLDPNGTTWKQNYANRIIQLTVGSLTWNSTILDTCANTDCGGCCATNAKKTGRYLVDMEHYTVLRHFGTTNDLPDSIEFTLF